MQLDLPRFARPDGRPFKIAVRGDCCSRRAITLNPEIFPHGVDYVINEKSPTPLFVDGMNAVTAPEQIGETICDTKAMSSSLRRFFLGQFNRSILELDNIDLMVMDSYADMHFGLWRHRQQNYRLWTHPKFLLDAKSFKSEFEDCGKLSLDAAIEASCQLIDHMRKANPGVPVMFLNQPVEYYPNLAARLQFYQLGEQIAARRPHVYFADPLAKSALVPDDMDSCGPGNTLHFDAATYLKMMTDAWGKGLKNHFDGNAVRLPLPRPTEATVQSAPEKPVKPPRARYSPSNAELPVAHINYGGEDATCGPRCDLAIENAGRTFALYFTQPDLLGKAATLRFTPMLIPVAAIGDFDAWEADIKKIQRGARLRLKRRAVAQGYYMKPFAWKMFTPDIHAINHSMPERSGGAMRASYLQSIEELGGAPEKALAVTAPVCNKHYNYCFGVFQAAEGHLQGKVLVNERLVAYLTVVRTGDIILYARIMGHGDHLSQGIMVLLHHEFVRWVSNPDNKLSEGLRYIMYGGAENGGEGLLQYKSQSGFKPHCVTALTGRPKLRHEQPAEQLKAIHAKLAGTPHAWLTRPVSLLMKKFKSRQAG